MNRASLVQDIIENLTKCQKAASPSDWRKIGLSHSQVGMLFMILHHKNANVKQISEYLGVTKSAITQLLDPMVSKGFIERQTDSHDRRIARFTLTDLGKKTLKQVHQLKSAGIRSALDTLSDEDLGQLARLHQKAAQNLSK
jgi:DNA-binding MarR family transcriptional regulator